MKQNRLVVLLLLIFSVLMSVPFLVPSMGAVALIALIPLLCAERLASINGIRRFLVVLCSRRVIQCFYNVVGM